MTHGRDPGWLRIRRLSLLLDHDDPRLHPVAQPGGSSPGPHAAESLKYRDFLTVALVIDRPELFPDNWIYIHDPGVHVGRIQNYKNWSRDMVADPSQTCLGMEYFCNQGDGLWGMDDQGLIRLAARELGEIGVARARMSSTVVSSASRMPTLFTMAITVSTARRSRTG